MIFFLKIFFLKTVLFKMHLVLKKKKQNQKRKRPKPKFSKAQDLVQLVVFKELKDVT